MNCRWQFLQLLKDRGFWRCNLVERPKPRGIIRELGEYEEMGQFDVSFLSLYSAWVFVQVPNHKKVKVRMARKQNKYVLALASLLLARECGK